MIMRVLRKSGGRVIVSSRPVSTDAKQIDKVKTDVLIVGGGPCGMLASLSSSKYGISSIVIEKDGPLPMTHPRAHVLNSRSMEILRKFGVETDVFARAPPKEDWTSFRYCEHILDHDDIARIDHSKTPEYEAIRNNSSSQVTQISQPILEEILRSHASRALTTTSNSQILYNHELVELDFRQKRARVKGPAGTFDIESKVVIGADGGKSKVRELCGINLQGKTFIESFTSVHFSSPTLAKFLRTKRKSAMLTFVFNPFVIAAVFVVHDIRGEGNFVTHLPFFPPAETPSQFERRDVIEPLVRRLLGPEEGRDITDLTIKSIRNWGMHATIADEFCSKDGWIAFVGDAVHQYPPSGGFGVNVGISEVDFLMNQILMQGPGEEAVRTHAETRRPIAKETVQVALDNYRRGLKVTEALGLERRLASLLSQALPNSLVDGSALLRRLSKFPITQALQNSDRLKNVKNVVERDRLALPLYFPQVDLGVNINTGKLDTIIGDCTVGKLMPHAWIFLPHKNRIVSTRDLTSPLFESRESDKPLITTFYMYRSPRQAIDSLGSILKPSSKERKVVLVLASNDESNVISEKLAPTCLDKELILALDRSKTLERLFDGKDVEITIDVPAHGFIESLKKK